MAQAPSLFARKLRDWRTRHGPHGRMTQENLAELLDVSVDAVGKYERSLSFIRGDLEHRLSQRLGWSQAEIIACRADWEMRQNRAARSAYRLMDQGLVDDHFNGSWPDAICELVNTAAREFGELPGELAAEEHVFVPLYDAHRDQICAVFHDGQVVGLWSIIFLTPEDEARLRAGRLVESDLTLEALQPTILPGTYYGYCPGLAVCRGHEAAAPLMMSAFVQFLESLAARDVLLHGLGTINVTPAGAQMCRQLGMTRLCDYYLNPDFGIWDLPGAAIAKSIFARRSETLQARYAAEFLPPTAASTAD